jgi:hypothetical protein
MGTDHKHQNEGLRCFSGWDLPIAAGFRASLPGENDQPGGWLFEKGMIEQHEAVHLGTLGRRRGVFR